MRKEMVKYTDAPAGVDDAVMHGKILTNAEKLALFASPEELVEKHDKKVKVTMMLDETSINFFKQQAAKNNTHYQTMINQVISNYVSAYN
jgi:predicted DNA binding CopG/RHH family protein